MLRLTLERPLASPYMLAIVSRLSMDLVEAQMKDINQREYLVKREQVILSPEVRVQLKLIDDSMLVRESLMQALDGIHTELQKEQDAKAQSSPPGIGGGGILRG